MRLVGPLVPGKHLESRPDSKSYRTSNRLTATSRWNQLNRNQGDEPLDMATADTLMTNVPGGHNSSIYYCNLCYKPIASGRSSHLSYIS